MSPNNKTPNKKHKNPNKKYRNPNTPDSGLKSALPWIAVVVVVLVLGVVAIGVSRAKKSDDDAAKQGTPGEWDSGQPVTVTGQPLAQLPDDPATPDPAIGKDLPLLKGVSAVDGSPVEWKKDGKAKVVVVMAHWCHVCQDEIPKLADYVEENGVPDNVELVGLSTRQDRGGGNYPPSKWLHNVDLDATVMTDSAGGNGAQALGVTAFPFFLVTDSEGKVLARTSGALNDAQLDATFQSAAGTK